MSDLGYLQLMRVDSKQIGYGRMGVYLDQEIRKLGYRVSNSLDDEPAGTVLHASTPSHLLRYYEGQRLVLLSMWEASTLPEAFREAIHLFDLLIVPSMQNLELFSQHHPNVAYVPLGIDPEIWKPTHRTAPGQRFEFLIGGTGARKGPDLAYKAFRMAFPNGSWGDGPEPWLTFKSPKANPFHGERISQINGRLSGEDEIALYARAHCYLQPSRGEGFGLQPLQAIAQASPTILTDAHGHASFAQYGIPISAKLAPTVPGSFFFGEAGDWWEPDVDELADRMRQVYDNYPEACGNAWESAEVVSREFTWEQTAKKVMRLLDPLPPYIGSGRLLRPEMKLFRVVLNRPHAADIAGHSYRWEAFQEAYVPADVKRILFDGGYLDPSCIEGDAGLTKAEVEAAGYVSGAESYCGTCSQRLGTQPTRADDLESEWAAR